NICCGDDYKAPKKSGRAKPADRDEPNLKVEVRMKDLKVVQLVRTNFLKRCRVQTHQLLRRHCDRNGCHAVPLRRLSRAISLPLALCVTSSMNARMSSRPRFVISSMLEGSAGSGRREMSKPGPSSRIM